jgi:hypothetical protein
MVIMAEKEDVVYSLVDIEGLATALAEEAWENETKEVSTEKLYHIIVEKDTGMKREVRPFYASIFFSIREKYKKVIEQFQKEE